MKNPILKKIIIAFFIVVGILLVLFLSKEIAVRFFNYKPPAISQSQVKRTKQVDVSFKEDEKYKQIVTERFIYFIGVNKITVADEDGNKKNEIDIVASQQIIKSSGEYVVVADAGGKNVYIIYGQNLKNTIQTHGKLVNASINSKGYTVVVTEGDMHKRDVTVYNVKGKEQFVWNSGSLFVLSAAIADNNKNIIISTLDTSEGKMKSHLSFYNISDVKPIASEDYVDELFAVVEIRGNYAYCIGDSKTCIYRISGDKNGEIPYNGKTLTTYRTGKSDIVMAFSESALSGKRYNIETYNTSGKRVGNYEIDYKINYLDFAENVIAINRGSLIDIVDIYGRGKKLIDPEIDINDLSFLGGTSKAVGFTANGAYIFSVK